MIGERALLLLTVLMVPVVLLLAQQPQDPYHDLHLPHDPPLHPTLHTVPQTSFSCADKTPGLHADVEAHCQAFHLCDKGSVSRSFLCPNGTLFHEEYAVCDQFYNVRCGIDRRID